MTPQPQQKPELPKGCIPDKCSLRPLCAECGSKYYPPCASHSSHPAPSAPKNLDDQWIESLQQQMKHDATIRNQTLDKLIKFIDKNNVVVPDEENEDSDDMLFTGEIRAKIESLRSEVPE